MSDTNRKTFTPTSPAEVKGASISSLADRPNVVSRYGDGGLSAAQLKARFDALPELNRKKINEIIDALNGAESTKYLGIGTDALSEFGVDNLYDLLVKMTTSDIANVFKALYESDTDTESKVYTLNEIFSNIAYRLSELKAQADENTEDIATNTEEIATLRDTTVPGIDSRLTTAEGAINALAQDNVGQGAQLDDHNTRITANANKIKEVDDAAKKEYGNIASAFNDHDARIKTWESWKQTYKDQIDKTIWGAGENRLRIEALEADNATNKSDISSLETAYELLAGTDATVKADIETIDEKLAAALAEAKEISDTVDAHIAVADKHIEDAAKELEEFDTKLKEYSDTVSDHDARITGIETDLSEVLQDGKKININSIVIGEGEAADLSIAGGTTDIDTYGKKAGLTTSEILALKAALALSGGVKESKATAPLSIALGANNESTSSGAISLGYGNKNSGFNSTTVGAMNTITGDSAFAYGYKNTINGDFGVAFGQENTAGNTALAGGILSEATGKGSLAFGNECEASGEYSIALGGDITASGIRSFAEGTNTTASGKYSHAQNEETIASGESSTAMGYRTEASGNQAFAGGRETIASARNSTALGFQTEAKHEQSFTSGRNLITGRENQTVVGEYNVFSEDALFVVGNGWAGSEHNAFEVKDDGTAYLNGAKVLTETKWKVLSDNNTGFVNFETIGNVDYEFYTMFNINGTAYKIMLGNLQFYENDPSDIIIGNTSAPVEQMTFYLKYEVSKQQISIRYTSPTESNGIVFNFNLCYRLIHE